MTKSVAAIFGGEAREKVMRLFIFNPGSVFDPKTVALRTQENRSLVSRTLRAFVRGGLLRKKTKGYTLDTECPYLDALEHFLVDAAPMSEKEIVKKVSKAGVLKLVLISGIFLHDSEARVDLLVVGDHLKKGKLVAAIKTIEAALGREIRYASFETPDFQYRLGMYDKLVRDILDFNHRKIQNKLGL